MRWRQFVRAAGDLGRTWVSRGGTLETTLERFSRTASIAPADLPRLELLLIREFGRHPAARDAAPEGDILAWLALMQHHGAPTRLLDWTYSPFVAAYFSLTDLPATPARPRPLSVWALDTRWLDRQVRRKVSPATWQRYRRRQHPDAFADLFVRRPPLRLVATATPRLLNERLSLQQGVFVCPGDVTRTWLENLRGLGNPGASGALREFHLEADDVPEALEALDRMNLTARILFPGLDGHARWVRARAMRLLQTDVPGLNVSGHRVADALWPRPGRRG